jgi:tRNA threonylcarbamoyladenosine biosynthesis protein TsaE
MLNNNIITVTLDQIDAIIDQHILPIAQPGVILLLRGQLGAGKTTLVKALLRKLGITDEITSPTFSYVNSYENEAKTLVVHHFDLYRLSSIDEFIMQGFDELLQQRYALSIIEWPEILDQFLTGKNKRSSVFYLDLTHNFDQPDARHLHITPVV